MPRAKRGKYADATALLYLIVEQKRDYRKGQLMTPSQVKALNAAMFQPMADSTFRNMLSSIRRAVRGDALFPAGLSMALFVSISVYC